MRLHWFLVLVLLTLPITAVHATTFTYSEAVYGSLQGAIDAARPGDTLVLPEGLYEGPIIVDKPLTIMGSGEGTRIVPVNGLSTLTIRSDSVRLSGVLFLVGNTGVGVEGSSHATVEDCTFVENAVGLDIAGGSNHVVRGNRFINNIACGAILQDVGEAIIEGNHFNYTQPDEWPSVKDLVGDVTSRVGLKLLRSGNLTVSANAFHNVGMGIYMGNSVQSTITGNSFHNSTVGLSMRDSTLNNVVDNDGHETDQLLFLWLSPYNNITGNTNQNGILSRDVDSNNLYQLSGVTLTGKNFILETSEPNLDPIFKSLSDALNITLLPDPVTDAAWVKLEVNSTGLHEDAIPGSLGLYTPAGQLLAQAEVVNLRTVVEYEVEGGAQLVFAKKVDAVSPVAVAGQDLASLVGEAVGFDASASTDDLGITEYRWSFGDGVESVGVRVAHQYDAAGVYTVRLVVVDSAGNTGQDSVQVTVFDEEAEEETGGYGVWPALVALLVVLSAGVYLWIRSRR